MSNPRSQTVVASTLAALLLSACAVGPDFKAPDGPNVASYGAGPVASNVQAGKAEPSQTFVTGADLPHDWWELFANRPLSDAVAVAIAGNQTLAAAQASLEAAKQGVRGAEGGLYPSIDISASVQRQKSSGGNSSNGVSGSGRVSNFYSVGPGVGYSLDLFGGTRRQIEQQEALADSQAYNVRAAYLALTGNVVTQAIAIASAREQIVATQEIIANDLRNLELVQAKYKGGKASLLDVRTAETQLANSQVRLPSLELQLSQGEHALTVLTGRFPAQWTPPAFKLANFTLPENLPLSLPSSLVRQRPDILQAEASLHAASAAVGVATANMYPDITLSAGSSFGSSAMGQLFNASSAAWSLAAGLSAPVFEGGTLEANRQAALENYRASAAIYQQTVLEGFAQVADQLKAVETDGLLMRQQRIALDTASDTLRMQRLSYREGKSNLVDLVNAQRSYAQARISYAGAAAQRFTDTASLFVALGGGWWNEPVKTAGN